MSAEGESWKVTLPCTRAEAEMLLGEVPALAGFEPAPVLLTSEPDPDRPERWQLDAYLDREPAPALLAALAALVPSAAGVDPQVERLGDEDWVTMSQAGIEPIQAGRFFVAPAARIGEAPAGTVPFAIEAGRAFGTGQHETTAGCLATLDGLRTRGARFRRVADIGTGTGILAFAAQRLWPMARIIASDIDPVSVEVARDNARDNQVALGRGPGAIELVAAPGLDHRRLAARAPYDLIIANILAGPLVALAPAIGAALAPGGTLVLAGLLDEQADRVEAAYRAAGLRPGPRGGFGRWPVLRLTKRRGARRPASSRAGRVEGDSSW